MHIVLKVNKKYIGYMLTILFVLYYVILEQYATFHDEVECAVVTKCLIE